MANTKPFITSKMDADPPIQKNIFEKIGIDGPNSFFTGRLYWSMVAGTFAGLLVFPLFGSTFLVSNLSNFFLNVPLALGLALLWGFAGILSFSQIAFFGIGGYAYGVIAINLGSGSTTFVAAAGSLGFTTLCAGIFGYFLFYGRVNSWIIPVLTLVFTLILETFMGQTAGYNWKIGDALLGGYNGMTGIPSLSFAGIEFNGYTSPLYFLVVVATGVTFLALRILTNSHFGHVVVAIREDTQRAELLGYDVRLYQFVVFMLAGALGGLSGILYVSWGNFITPSTIGLLAATMPVLWVAVGGKASLTAVALATVFLGLISDSLAVYSGEFAFVLLGALLLFGMMFAPEGIIVTITNHVRRLATSRRQS